MGIAGVEEVGEGAEGTVEGLKVEPPEGVKGPAGDVVGEETGDDGDLDAA